MLHLTTIVKFILSSISNDWLFWSVNHTIIASYSELNVFKKIWFVISYQTVYSEQKCAILLNLADNHYWQCYNELVLLLQFRDVVHFHHFCLLSLLPSNFIVSDVKSSRVHPFSIWFTYICTDGLSTLSPCFF